MPKNHAELEQLFAKYALADFRWITAESIAVAQWVRVKCSFGCPSYGQNGVCPPYVPPVRECAEFINEYREIVLFHFEVKFDKSDEASGWYRETNKKLLQLEQDVFHAGFYKTFLLSVSDCNLCKKCAGTRIDCKKKESARPTPEAFAIDVFATARNCGYPIDVLADSNQKMDRYAFLLVE